MNSYDEVPYASQAFAQTHPDRLATLGRIFGLAAPAIEHCRVLELGCAAGGNLIPMAYALPGSEFVGVDLSHRQVAEGRQRIAALGLRNVRIEHASIMDVDAGWGRFDYPKNSSRRPAKAGFVNAGARLCRSGTLTEWVNAKGL